MSPNLNHIRNCAVVFFAAALSAQAANLPPDWQHVQPFEVAASGIVKINLPIDALNSARPSLEDLRVYDEAGNEMPYLIEHPTPAGRIVRAAKSFQTSLNSQTTVITIETGLTQPLNGLTLESPANNFIKSVFIEGSSDGRNWRSIARGQAIFRQPNGASELHLQFPPAAWSWLRLTVDDQRSQPVPFTGARVEAASGEFAPNEDVSVTISDRQEAPGETRLTLKLPAGNLTLSTIQLDSSDALFTRQVTVAVPQVAEDSIRESPIGQGVIYRLALEGEPVSANLSLPLERQVTSRELLLLIHNLDSPPLTITAAHAQRRPVYLVFLAKQAGTYYLMTGNASCLAPRYDLAALQANLKAVAVQPVEFSAMSDNPNFRAPETLPDVAESGTTLDVSAWKFRKRLGITRGGAQQIEFDADVLASAQPGFEDVRLLRGGKQVPYIIERTSLNRKITPGVTVTTDKKDPRISRWILKLPRPSLPLTQLTCEVSAGVFQRDMAVYEELHGAEGDIYQHVLGQATWTQTPNRAGREFTVPLQTTPQSDTLYLETQNGDNPAIELGKFALLYPVTRALFKATAGDEIFLYYGNSEASAPHYDVSLVANELLAADKETVSAGAEETLKYTARQSGVAGKGGVVFWGILGLVVVVLLVIIARLLPKAESQPPK